MTATLKGGEWSAARPGRTSPPGKTRYPFYSRLGGPQGWPGRAEKSLPHWNSIPDLPARRSVTTPTELPGLLILMIGYCFYSRKQRGSIFGLIMAVRNWTILIWTEYSYMFRHLKFDPLKKTYQSIMNCKY